MAQKQPPTRTPPPNPPGEKTVQNRALSKKDKRKRKRDVYRTRVMRPEGLNDG